VQRPSSREFRLRDSLRCWFPSSGNMIAGIVGGFVHQISLILDSTMYRYVRSTLKRDDTVSGLRRNVCVPARVDVTTLSFNARTAHKPRKNPSARKKLIPNCPKLRKPYSQGRLRGVRKPAVGRLRTVAQGENPQWSSFESCATYFACLNTAPSFITKSTSFSASMLVRGSPETATISAYPPGAITPVRLSHPGVPRLSKSRP